MKKDRNSTPDSTERDFSLPKAEVLRGRSSFQRLFGPGATTIRNRSVDLRFRMYPDRAEECLMGFIAKKKLGKAVHRNRVKRLLREAYRLNKHILTDLFENSSFSFHGVLMAKTLDMDYSNAEPQVINLLEKARKHVLSTIQSNA